MTFLKDSSASDPELAAWLSNRNDVDFHMIRLVCRFMPGEGEVFKSATVTVPLQSYARPPVAEVGELRVQGPPGIGTTNPTAHSADGLIAPKSPDSVGNSLASPPQVNQAIVWSLSPTRVLQDEVTKTTVSAGADLKLLSSSFARETMHERELAVEGMGELQPTALWKFKASNGSLSGDRSMNLIVMRPLGTMVEIDPEVRLDIEWQGEVRPYLTMLALPIRISLPEAM